MAKKTESPWLSMKKKQFLYNEEPKNYRNLLLTVLKNSSIDEINSLFFFLKKNNKFKGVLSYSNIKNPLLMCNSSQIAINIFNDIHNNIPDENIFIWSQLNIESNKSIINYFLVKKNEFSKYRLLSDFENSSLVLDEIERELGFSWWLIEARISLIQEHGGKVAQVEYINNLLLTHKSNGLFSWILERLSERNEDKTQLTHFFNRLEYSLDSYDIPIALKNYLQSIIIKKQTELSISTLILDSFGHVIDLYEHYVNITAYIFNNFSDVPEFIIRSVRDVVKKIKSFELMNCLMIVDPNLRKKFSDKYRISNHGEEFLTGNLDKAIDESIKVLKNDPMELESLIIISSSNKAIEKIKYIEHSIIYKLVKDLNIFRLFNDRSPSAFERIRKITANNYSINLSKIIDSITIEKSNLPLVESTGFSTRFLFSSKIDIFTIPLINEKFNQTVKNINNEILEIKNIIKVSKYENFSEIDSLTSNLIIRNENSELYLQNKAYLLNQRAIALIETNKIYECIIFCVDHILCNKFLLTILPITKIIKGKRWPQLKEYRESIELSIIIYLYLLLNEDSLQKTNLGFAWDWFRKSQNILNISNLFDVEHLNKEKVIYFLSEISTPEVMESHSDGLDTPESTLVSRSQILVKLIENDKSRNKFYEKEQVSLLKSISIQRGLDKLNQNKLYIDSTIIKSWALRELESSYERYQETLSHPELLIKKDESNEMEEIVQMVQMVQKMMTINNDEYISLFRQISDEYLNNKQGGLNFFLSMRIRHGKLESTLRKSLSDNNLLTTKINSDSNVYNKNEYWREKLNLNDKDNELLNIYFSSLSESFDLCISDYKDNKIRCLSDKFPYGLFYINPLPNELLELKNKIETGVSFDVFCNECISLCKKDIENKLPMIKSRIDKEIIENINYKLNELLVFSENKNYKELSESIKNTRSQFKKTGNIVKEWFNFDNVDVNKKSLTLEDCVDISLYNIKDVHSDFTLEVKKKLSSIKNFKLSDIDSNNVNEVLYILLDNIYKRSGLKNNVRIRIRIKKFNHEHISISMINEVAENVICSENINKLKEIKTSIDNGIYQNKASDDNNSGLLKLRNMNHSKDNNCLNFGFKFNCFFIRYNLKLTITKGF